MKSSITNLKPMVLAAGLGTRLRPLTDKLPKALAPVAGRPMILYTLLWLKSYGLTEVTINSHYLADTIESELGDGSSLGLSIRWSREEELLGTGGGVGRARRFFPDSPMLLANADTLMDVDLEALMEFHWRMRPLATMAVIELDDPSPYTPVLADRDGLVRSIGGRPDPGREGGLVPVTFTGVSILEPALMDLLPSDSFASLAADGFVPAMAGGGKVAAYFHKGYFKPVDNIERLAEAEADIKSGRFRPRGI